MNCPYEEPLIYASKDVGNYFPGPALFMFEVEPDG